LHPGAGVRHAAGRRMRHRDRPPGHAPDRQRQHPRRGAVPGAAAPRLKARGVLSRLLQSYDIVLLQRMRSVLEDRGIVVHISDEFTVAIAGLPGAEQPRGLWGRREDRDAAVRALRLVIPPDELPPLEDE